MLVAWSVVRATRTRRPAPAGGREVDHGDLAPILGELKSEGVGELPRLRGEIGRYRKALEAVDPDELSRSHALAYWLNLYNAGALDLAAEAAAGGRSTVLRVPGGFSRPWTTVAGELLSLDAIEHGKLRRFGDPRIHGALVCGSASCPTLRYEPYDGADVDAQLEEQMRAFLGGGGVIADRDGGRLHLSRIFLWYGADFVRPHRMPAWIPASKRSIAAAIEPWLSDDVGDWVTTTRPAVGFQPYDWSLACSIR